ncbi:hypothetical protein DOY81_001537, partial [Sarcophaga bullata]
KLQKRSFYWLYFITLLITLCLIRTNTLLTITVLVQMILRRVLVATLKNSDEGEDNRRGVIIQQYFHKSFDDNVKMN